MTVVEEAVRDGGPDAIELDVEHLAAIVDAVADGITVQRPDGGLVFANAEAARASGFDSPAEMLATPRNRLLSRFDLFDEAGRPMAAAKLPGAIVLAGGPANSRVVGFRDHETGAVRWAQVTSTPVEDGAAGVRYAVNAFHDITFRQDTERVLRAREAEARTLRREAEQAAGRADRLHRLAIDLTGVASIEAAVELTVQRADQGLGVRAMGVYLASDDRSRLDLAEGSSDGDLGPMPHSVEATAEYPVAAAFREREAQWLGSLDDLASRFPASAECARAAGAGAVAALPLAVEDVILGAVVADFRDGQAFDVAQRETLRAVVHLLAQAVHRIRLAEARERLLAERDAERARLSTLLAERLADESRLADLVRAEHARAAELHAIVRAIGDPIVVVAADGSITVANRSAEQLLGALPERTAAGLLDAFERANRPTVAGLVDHSPQLVHETGGQRRWFEVSAYPVAQDRAGEVILILRDVTEARQREAVRDSFIGVLSHELRTPLTTIYAGAQVLASHPATLAEATRVEIFQDIQSEAERLHRLVEDVLALTRFGEGGPVIGTDPVLLQRVIPLVIRAERTRWPSGRFDVVLEADLPPVAGDMTYVEQVVRNLLANAMKYGGPTSTARIEAAVEGDEVAVRVLDRGPGFDAAEAGRLFELYYRSPAVARTISGSGIGLFVCARLVEAMGGRVWASNRPEGGAEFGFTLRILGDAD